MPVPLYRIVFMYRMRSVLIQFKGVTIVLHCGFERSKHSLLHWATYTHISACVFLFCIQQCGVFEKKLLVISVTPASIEHLDKVFSDLPPESMRLGCQQFEVPSFVCVCACIRFFKADTLWQPTWLPVV
ncbi:hypothetical protein GOODEAATRI_007605 [Goodea atripinnis]|uniref:Uncharacterized protein n=1 Tax=Goodea atripinnis TaxID=208336 RepID=A0ABV0PLS3_9TELE